MNILLKKLTPYLSEEWNDNFNETVKTDDDMNFIIEAIMADIHNRTELTIKPELGISLLTSILQQLEDDPYDDIIHWCNEVKHFEDSLKILKTYYN